MKIYDVFPFNNELDLMLLRMHLLDSLVDYFVISESSVSFSGLNKPLRYLENKAMYSRFESKIIHVIAEPGPESLTTFERDDFQKNQLGEALRELCCDDDIILSGDLDEFPNPRVFAEAVEAAQEGKIGHFAQDVYVYYLNFQEYRGKFISITGDYPGIKNPRWLGTRSVKFSLLRETSIAGLRDRSLIPQGVRLSDGGWHFTYVGGPPGSSIVERVRQKISDSPHQELMKPATLDKVPKRILRGHDPWGRRGVRMRKVTVDPAIQVLVNKNNPLFNHLLLA
jgi:beta-1,4-mannosyl-glycoprotein beta-1,4-N-acetylglucosaminyltransferase